MTPGHSLQALPLGSGGGGGVSTLKTLLCVLWTILNKMNMSKLQSDAFEENRAWERGTSCRPITFDS